MGKYSISLTAIVFLFLSSHAYAEKTWYERDGIFYHYEKGNDTESIQIIKYPDKIEFRIRLGSHRDMDHLHENSAEFPFAKFLRKKESERTNPLKWSYVRIYSEYPRENPPSKYRMLEDDRKVEGERYRPAQDHLFIFIRHGHPSVITKFLRLLKIAFFHPGDMTTFYSIEDEQIFNKLKKMVRKLDQTLSITHFKFENIDPSEENIDFWEVYHKDRRNVNPPPPPTPGPKGIQFNY